MKPYNAPAGTMVQIMGQKKSCLNGGHGRYAYFQEVEECSASLKKHA